MEALEFEDHDGDRAEFQIAADKADPAERHYVLTRGAAGAYLTDEQLYELGAAICRYFREQVPERLEPAPVELPVMCGPRKTCEPADAHAYDELRQLEAILSTVDVMERDEAERALRYAAVRAGVVL